MELILRSMLQVVGRNEFGRPKLCKMHDLLREIGLSISEGEKFGVVYDGKVEIDQCQSRQPHRLSIQTAKWELQSYSSMTRLHSLNNYREGVMPDIHELWIKSYFALKAVPQGIEFLTNLRTLDLSYCSPSLIGSIEDVESKDYSKADIT
ncbi:hypothetical protein GH714_014027 [Hevea brasiliensis]|uniref:Rx N-terminal domain-containing protein n=1 Tax=Hevea brasiliensis TaxID=3981 RepID=A0A6A6L6A8_HEVBR|nr:hypothetical protein GH714_014027 [Hevea brasiliensis]